MILVDTSVWVDHLRHGNSQLKTLLGAGQVVIHPFVVGELALGNLRQRNAVLSALRDLPHAVSASNEEVLDFIESQALPGLGIGLVDAHLLASARLTSAHLWTRDKRLSAAADKLGLAARSS
jgi:predicted nucleic acid-binding protein